MIDPPSCRAVQYINGRRGLIRADALATYAEMDGDRKIRHALPVASRRFESLRLIHTMNAQLPTGLRLRAHSRRTVHHPPSLRRDRSSVLHVKFLAGTISFTTSEMKLTTRKEIEKNRNGGSEAPARRPVSLRLVEMRVRVYVCTIPATLAPAETPGWSISFELTRRGHCTCRGKRQSEAFLSFAVQKMRDSFAAESTRRLLFVSPAFPGAGRRVWILSLSFVCGVQHIRNTRGDQDDAFRKSTKQRCLVVAPSCACHLSICEARKVRPRTDFWVAISLPQLSSQCDV